MRLDPGTPSDWMRFARSDLAVARRVPDADVLMETLCFHAQQAVEKSLKAVLLTRSVAFPHTHNLRILMDLVSNVEAPPPDVVASVGLAEYAVEARYPGIYEDITEDEYREAVRLATVVVVWAETACALSAPARN